MSKWFCSALIVLLFPLCIGSSTPIRNVFSLPEITICAKKMTKPKHHKCLTEYLGFKLRGKVNTKISDELKLALESFNGPKVGINSLRRYWNRNSEHYHGNAVDLEFKQELIDWLVSEEGLAWLSQHDLIFYIEGKPSSRGVTPFERNEKYREYVLRNPRATGDHIHIQIK